MGSEERCPHCNSEEYDGSECYECMFLECPVCGEVVHDFGETGELSPCKHLIAWGIIGNDEVYWENSEYEHKYHDFRKEKEKGAGLEESMYEEDILTEYVDKFSLDYIVHSDEAGHGGSRAMFLVFLKS